MMDVVYMFYTNSGKKLEIDNIWIFSLLWVEGFSRGSLSENNRVIEHTEKSLPHLNARIRSSEVKSFKPLLVCFPDRPMGRKRR